MPILSATKVGEPLISCHVAGCSSWTESVSSSDCRGGQGLTRGTHLKPGDLQPTLTLKIIFDLSFLLSLHTLLPTQNSKLKHLSKGQRGEEQQVAKSGVL